jgi:hypothetical protein
VRIAPSARQSGSGETFSMVVVGNYRNRAELRKKPRRHFHYNAQILMGKDAPPLACSISDISQTGARIALEREEKVPDTFMLLLTPNGDARRHCRVIWRDGLNLGVQFPENH